MCDYGLKWLFGYIIIIVINETKCMFLFFPNIVCMKSIGVGYMHGRLMKQNV